MPEETYICEGCKQTFTKEVSDEKAMEETRKQFGPVSKEDCYVVCDDCYLKFMAWLQHNNTLQ